MILFDVTSSENECKTMVFHALQKVTTIQNETNELRNAVIETYVTGIINTGIYHSRRIYSQRKSRVIYAPAEIT